MKLINHLAFGFCSIQLPRQLNVLTQIPEKQPKTTKNNDRVLLKIKYLVWLRDFRIEYTRTPKQFFSRFFFYLDHGHWCILATHVEKQLYSIIFAMIWFILWFATNAFHHFARVFVLAKVSRARELSERGLSPAINERFSYDSRRITVNTLLARIVSPLHSFLTRTSNFLAEPGLNVLCIFLGDLNLRTFLKCS